jgi:hypothetical protein
MWEVEYDSHYPYSGGKVEHQIPMRGAGKGGARLEQDQRFFECCNNAFILVSLIENLSTQGILSMH